MMYNYFRCCCLGGIILNYRRDVTSKFAISTVTNREAVDGPSVEWSMDAVNTILLNLALKNTFDG